MLHLLDADEINEDAEPFYGSIPVSREELIRKLRVLGFQGPFTGGRHELMAGKKAIAGPQAGRIIPREAGPW